MCLHHLGSCIQEFCFNRFHEIFAKKWERKFPWLPKWVRDEMKIWGCKRIFILLLLLTSCETKSLFNYSKDWFHIVCVKHLSFLIYHTYITHVGISFHLFNDDISFCIKVSTMNSRNKSKLHRLLCSIQSTCSICSFTFGVEVIFGSPLGIQYLLSLHWVPGTLDDDTTTFQTATVRVLPMT